MKSVTIIFKTLNTYGAKHLNRDLGLRLNYGQIILHPTDFPWSEDFQAALKQSETLFNKKDMYLEDTETPY